MAAAPRRSISQKGAADPPPTVAQTPGNPAAVPAGNMASKAASAAKGAVSRAGKVASGAARQAQVAAQVAAQGAAQVTKAAAARAAVPVAKLAQKLGGDAGPKTLKSVDAAEKGVVPMKPLEESELDFEEEEVEGPNHTLIFTSFLVYVLFVATCVVFAEYSFQNYDLDPSDIRTHAPPLGTERDNTTTPHSAIRRLSLRRHKNDTNITFLDRAPAETEPEFDWDALRLEEMLTEEYVPEVLSNQILRARDSGTTTRPVQHAPGLYKDVDYIPEILEN